MATENPDEYSVTADPIIASENNVSDNLLDLAATIDQYYTPILCLFGAFGNFLSIVVFFTKTHKGRSGLSSSVYLSALAISDTGFLINLFILWLNNRGIDLLTNVFICPTVMYLGQVTGFLSVWFVVAFTVERFFAVCYPLSRHTRCTASRARKITAGLTIFAAIAFSYVCVIAQVIQIPSYNVKGATENATTFRTEEMTWTDESLSRLPVREGSGSSSGLLTETFQCNTSFPINETKMKACQPTAFSKVNPDGNGSDQTQLVCSVPEKYIKISEISNYIDSVLTFIIPFIVIFCLNLKIIFCVKRFKDHRDGMLASMKISHRYGTNHSCRSSCPAIKTTETPKLRDYLTLNGKGKEQTKLTKNRSNYCCKCGKMPGSLSSRVSRSLKRKASKSERVCIEVSAKPSEESDCQSQASSGQITPPFKRTLTNHSTSAMEIRITKTLLLISTVFLLLHFPSHSIRVASFIQSFGGSVNTQRNLYVAQFFANILFNTNFAVNFLLYCCSGKAFRHSARNLLSCQPAYASPLRSNTTTMTTQVHLNNMEAGNRKGSRYRHETCLKIKQPPVEEQV